MGRHDSFEALTREELTVRLNEPDFAHTAEVVGLMLAAIKAGRVLDIPDFDWKLVAPHQIFTLPYDAVSRRELAAAEFAGWHFLLSSGGRIFGSVDIPYEGADPVFQNGAFEVSAAEIFHSLPSPLDASSIRQLRINSLYLWLVWITADAGDVLIPLSPAPNFIEAARRYTPEELFNCLNQVDVMPFVVPR